MAVLQLSQVSDSTANEIAQELAESGVAKGPEHQN